jgi:hypothetical protein
MASPRIATPRRRTPFRIPALVIVLIDFTARVSIRLINKKDALLTIAMIKNTAAQLM